MVSILQGQILPSRVHHEPPCPQHVLHKGFTMVSRIPSTVPARAGDAYKVLPVRTIATDVLPIRRDERWCDCAPVSCSELGFEAPAICAREAIPNGLLN